NCVCPLTAKVGCRGTASHTLTQPLSSGTGSPGLTAPPYTAPGGGPPRCTPPAASRLPSGLKETHHGSKSVGRVSGPSAGAGRWPCGRGSGARATSHTFTTESAPALATRVPSGLHATAVAMPAWSFSATTSAPLSASHTLTAQSPPAVAIHLPPPPKPTPLT